MDKTIPEDSFLYTDRFIFNYLSAFQLPSFQYDRSTDRLLCTGYRRNLTLLVVIVLVVVPVTLAYHEALLVDVDDFVLHNLFRIFRGISTMYAVQSLMIAALSQRKSMAQYFQYLSDFDRRIWAAHGIVPDCQRVRRTFWIQMTVVLINYLFVSMAYLQYQFGVNRPIATAFVVMLNVTSIGQCVANALAQYSAQCCRCRYECVRRELSVSVAANDTSSDQLNRLRSAVRLLDEIDLAKERLQVSFGSMLTMKITIDYINTLASIFFAFVSLLDPDDSDQWEILAEYGVFEVPLMASGVLMVGHFDCLGAEVSDIRHCILQKKTPEIMHSNTSPEFQWCNCRSFSSDPVA